MSITEMPADVQLSSEVVATHGPFELLSTGVVATRPSTFEEWEAAVTWAQRVDKASLFWVGDLIEYGERNFGEKYTYGLDWTNYTEQALKDIAYVARNVDPSRRRDELSFSHHREVAALSPVEQTNWLDAAEGLQLSVHELRHRIKTTKTQARGHHLEFWLQVRCMDISDRDQLAERFRLEGREVKRMTK